MPFPPNVKPGVVVGQDLHDLLKFAKDEGFGACVTHTHTHTLAVSQSRSNSCLTLYLLGASAIPAVNCVSTSSVNAVLEAAAKVKSPVMLQVSNGGAQFFAGKSIPNDKQQASVAGAIRYMHACTHKKKTNKN